MRAALFALVVLLFAPAALAGGVLGTDRYDGCIRQSATLWWPAGPDWLW